MELNSKISNEVWVFNAFEYFQLVCRLLDCFVIIWLESNLVSKKKSKNVSIYVIQNILKHQLFFDTYLFHGHQFSSVNINASVHLTILALPCLHTGT